jgi:hypothetical protein
LLTGTYRLVFSLYDNDTKIGDIIRYIIIRWGIYGRRIKKII